jgi:hypothetical protein
MQYTVMRSILKIQRPTRDWVGWVYKMFITDFKENSAPHNASREIKYSCVYQHTNLMLNSELSFFIASFSGIMMESDMD